MSRQLSILGLCGLVFAFAGCGGNGTPSQSSETPPSRSEPTTTSRDSHPANQLNAPKEGNQTDNKNQSTGKEQGTAKKLLGTGDDFAKSKKEYAKKLGVEVSGGMKEDKFLQKHPEARKSRISSKPEKGVAVYIVQSDDRNSESSTWFFYRNSLIGVSRYWKPDDDSYQKRHKETMDGLGTPECDKVSKTDEVARADTPHNYSWKISDIDLFIQYEVSNFTGLSQSITVCSLAGVGRDIDIMGFHGNFVEHYKTLALSKLIDPVQGGTSQSIDNNSLHFPISIDQIKKELGTPSASDEDFVDYRDKLNIRVSSLNHMEVMAQTNSTGMELTTKFFKSKLFTEEEGKALLDLVKAKGGDKKAGRFEITAKESIIINGMVIMKVTPLHKK